MKLTQSARRRWSITTVVAALLAIVACQPAAQGTDSPTRSQVSPAEAALSSLSTAPVSLVAQESQTESDEEAEAPAAPEEAAPGAAVATPELPAGIPQTIDPAALNQIIDIATLQNAMNQLSQMSSTMDSMTVLPAPTPPSQLDSPISIVLTPGGEPMQVVFPPTFTPTR